MKKPTKQNPKLNNFHIKEDKKKTLKVNLFKRKIENLFKLFIRIFAM